MKIEINGTIYNLTFRLEPIINRCFDVYGYELLTGVYNEYKNNYINPSYFFNTLNLEACLEILNVQIGKVNSLKSKNTTKIVSVNLNEKMLRLVVSHPELISSVYMLRDILRVEISEEIDLGKNLESLTKLRKLVPLWLDDFGCGDITNQKEHMHLFEIVKIDRQFLKNILAFKSGKYLIDEIIWGLHMKKIDVICEGVENITAMETYFKHNFEGYQGWLWESKNI
ncbi:TPA: EAL domain-containing protein [Enterobacter asburiae]|uniref:EAL domain-containing protein n=1 Tax=Enterobacter asburiae TaxID=61645 RepID=UPI0010B668A9|nr:EAL domain-containing protein [Enterobacter asburiae]BEK81555.1 EAL domain-containing protein [Enterobacter asburiae]HEC5301821.1 EAL domain-containing protein [Enterobacter asburiae]